MKKSYFYPFAAAFLLLALAFASCSSPFFGSAKSAKVSLRLNLPDKPESNIPEGILRDLAEMTSHNSPGSRLIHPEGKLLELEIRQGNKVLFSIAEDIDATKGEHRIDSIILPVKTMLNIEVRFYERSDQTKLLGSTSGSIYINSIDESEILVGIKPFAAIPGEVTIEQGNSKDISFNVSGHSDNIFILELPAGLEASIYKMELDNPSTNHFNSVILYNENGTKHKGALTGKELQLTSQLGQNLENEIYFGHKNPDTTYYALLKSEVVYNYDITITLTKLEDELLVLAEKTWEEDDWTVPFIFPNEGELNFGVVYPSEPKDKNTINISVFNPYQHSLSVQLSLENAGTDPDRFSYNTPAPNNKIPVYPKQQLGFIVTMKYTVPYKAVEQGNFTIFSDDFDESFIMSFSGKQNS